MTDETVTVFESGASRSEMKPAYHLIPQSALARLARRLDEGAVQHGRWNFLNGANDLAFKRQIIDHAIDHLLMYKDGIEADDDHPAAVMAGMAMLCEFEARGAVKAGDLGVPKQTR